MEDKEIKKEFSGIKGRVTRLENNIKQIKISTRAPLIAALASVGLFIVAMSPFLFPPEAPEIFKSDITFWKDIDGEPLIEVKWIDNNTINCSVIANNSGNKLGNNVMIEIGFNFIIESYNYKNSTKSPYNSPASEEGGGTGQDYIALLFDTFNTFNNVTINFTLNSTKNIPKNITSSQIINYLKLSEETMLRDKWAP